MKIKKESFSKIRKFIKEHKRYTLTWIIVLWILMYSFSWSAKNETQIQKTHIVTSWSIRNSIKVLWETKITNQQKLTFWYEWTVKTLHVKEWDVVKKDQLLAEIDKWDLQKNIAQQSLSLQNTKIGYQKALTQYSEVDKMRAQQNIDEALLKLSLAKKNLQDMTTTQGESFQTNDTWVQSLLISSKSMLIDVKSMLESIDKIFWFTNKSDYEYKNIFYCISENDPIEKSRTEAPFNASLSKIITIEKSIQNIESSQVVTAEILQTLQNANKELLETLSTMFDHGLNAAQATSLCWWLKQSQIDSWASTINNWNTKVLSYISSINSNLKTIQSSKTDILNKKNEIKNYEVQLAANKETLEKMIEWLSYEDKTIQTNNIKQSEISISKLQEQRKNYELKAPFDGNIDMITFKIGDNITNNIISSEWITVSNPNFYEINMLIDQVDIVKIEKGQLANITFDAYPWYTITGEISNIDPTPTISAGVVSYTAIIVMGKWEKKIYDSMTVNIEIMTEQADNIIVVPTTAIQTRWEKTFVQTKESGATIIKMVEIWVNDNFNTEIISWLNIWETVLLNEYSISSSSKRPDRSTWSSFPNPQQWISSMRWLGVGWASWFPR